MTISSKENNFNIKELKMMRCINDKILNDIALIKTIAYILLLKIEYENNEVNLYTL
jgi:hypothetical protein